MTEFWSKQGWELMDKHLAKLAEMPFQREFKNFTVKPGLYTIRGPRQIGKSSWLKSLLSDLVRQDGANCAFFYSCENLVDHKDLHELLKIYQNRKYILLDEVTFIKDWYRPIKHLLDTTFHGTIIVTGSNLIDIRKGSDRMPGREGGGEDLTLLPMDFKTFSRAWKQAGFKELSRAKMLEKYFIIGGFPMALAEAGDDSYELSRSQSNIEKWILGDVIKAGYQRSYAKEVLSQIALTLTSQMSVNKLAARTQIGSHHTVSSYLDLLEDMFVIRTLYSVDPNTGSYRFKKEKKYYFTDPLVARVAMGWLGLKITDIDIEQLAEMAVHEFLAQHFEHLGFLVSKKSGEVDFLGFRRWAIEVKWSDAIGNLSKSYKNLVIPYKRVWNQENMFDLEGFL